MRTAAHLARIPESTEGLRPQEFPWPFLQRIGRATRHFVAGLCAFLTGFAAWGQNCNQGYSFTASPLPNGGTYEAGQTVTFCYTLTFWNEVSSNWFHGVVPSFGAGWDLSTLVPGPPPPTCGNSGGAWDWYALCDGTGANALPPVGPGFFFDLDNDGNPGNNFGDYCTGAVNWQFCFTISVASGGACVPGASLNVSVNSYGDSETGGWFLGACQGDPIALQQATAVCCNANAGQNGSVTLCSSDTPVVLNAQLGGTPDPGGTWAAPGGSATSAVLDPATATPGAYTYTVSNGNCSASAVVNVSIVPAPNAGGDGNAALCANGQGQDLFTWLNGTPQGGGTWTAPGGAPHSGTFQPASDAPGPYTYTVQGMAPCGSDQATVLVAVVQPPNAGGDGAITLCSSGAPVGLLGLLAAPQQGGAWSFNGAPHGASFNPSTDPPGVYTYTVPGTPPCAADQATALITLQQPPDAGLDAAITLCDTGPPTDLFAELGGTPGSGGTWTFNGAPHGSLFTPGIDGAGAYVHTVAGTAPCPADQASVLVTLADQPDAGLDGSITVCSSDAAFTLFALLGGAPEPGGTWSLNGAPHPGVFNPGTGATSVLTYTITGAPPCPSASAGVSVTVIQAPNAGSDGVLTACNSGAPVDLFSQLVGASPGGTWTFGGAPHGTQFTPGVDGTGTYTYTLPGQSPCPADQASVVVAVTADPDPGTDGALTICSNGGPADLFLQLGGSPQAGGTWSLDGLAVDGLFDPATDPVGTYAYTITVPPPCTSASSTVVVQLEQPPSAGGDGQVTLCASGAVMDLFTQLGGSPDTGGSWSGPDAVPGGLFDPATTSAGTYTYSVNGTGFCAGDAAQVNVALIQAPDAGLNGAVTVCTNGAPVDLFAYLGGDPDNGGAWSGPGALAGGIFDPTALPAGTYTYTVNAPPPCGSASSTVDVTLADPADAGSGSALTVCSTDAPVDLFALLGGSPDAGGTWTVAGTPHPATLDPATDQSGSYTYTVAGNPACDAASASIAVEVIGQPLAGNDAAITLCPGGAAVDLFDALGGSPDPGGTWTGPGGGVMSGVFDPVTDAPGICTYTITAAAPCTSDQAQVVVGISPAITAAVTTTDAICNGACDGSAVLQVSGGTPDLVMDWSGGMAGPSDLEAEDLCAGPHAVTITDGNGCTMQVAFTIGQPPAITVDAIGTTPESCNGLCDGTATVVDAEAVLYSMNGGGTWQANALFTGLCGGVQVFMVQDASGCTGMGSASVMSPPPVVAAFSASSDVVDIENTEVTFQNLSTQTTVFEWDFAGLGTSTDVNPSFTFPGQTGGIYPVCLTATNAENCTDSVCEAVVVLEELIAHIPNAFTPNGDGMNEVFAPVFNNPQFVQEYELLVFDRWGRPVFQSTRVGEPWDGFTGGDAAMPGVYVWKLRCRDMLSRRRQDLTGHVTVVR